MRSKWQVFLMGVAMGVADVIPGISGGTIAFLFGIYERLLLAIQSLHLGNLKKAPWNFLLPLGSGIACSFLFFAQILHLFLESPTVRPYLFSLFFGLILASCWVFSKKAEIKTPVRITFFLLGAVVAFVLSGDSFSFKSDFSFFSLVVAGALAAGAMLLPGISGSYLLCLLGVYPAAIKALANLSEGWILLLPLALGIILGLVCFSRVIHWLLEKFPQLTHSLLTGFMLGGLRSIWPFHNEIRFSFFLIILISAAFLIFLESRRGKQIV